MHINGYHIEGRNFLIPGVNDTFEFFRRWELEKDKRGKKKGKKWWKKGAVKIYIWS